MDLSGFDRLDNAVIYGVVGGLTCAIANWIQKNSPKLENKDILKYLAFFGVTGCLGGAFAASVMPDSSSITTAAVIGGFVGSYFLLGVAQYM